MATYGLFGTITAVPGQGAELEAHLLEAAASLELESVQTLISRARPIIAGMGDQYELDVVGGKGIG